MPKPKPQESKPDFQIQDEGTIVLICPYSADARAWIDDNVQSEDWQWLGPNLAVDHRFAQALVRGMLGSGLVIAK